MSIKINGSNIIDDGGHALNVSSIVFADATVQSSGDVGGAPIGDIALNEYSLVHVLDNPNAYGTGVFDNFGRVVAISGNYVIVGAYAEDGTSGGNEGKVYIFDVSTGKLIRTLNNPNAYGIASGDQFGISVAISSNYAIVGAYYEADAGGIQSGKVYVFDVTTGDLVHTLDNPNAYDTSHSDNFGYSVAISGNYTIVGTYREDDAGGTSSGKAYIFDVTTGALVHTLNNPNAYGTGANDYFGYSVAISGNYTIVGAYGEDDAGGTQSGKAYIFNVTTGALVHTLNNPSPNGSDIFGWSVAISGNYVIVGTPGDATGATGSGSGNAFIFNVETGALVHTIYNPNAYGNQENDRFGQTVAMSGNYAAVGALYEDDSGLNNSGKVYIFNVTTGELLYTLDNPNAYGTSQDDNFGHSIAISGNNIIIGVQNEDALDGSGSGKAYIFNLDEVSDGSYIEEIELSNGYTLNFQTDKLFRTAHSQGELIRTINNPNVFSTPQDDNFGFNVAIDGNRIITSALGEDSASGTESGAVYIFDAVQGNLLQTLYNPNSYGTSNDYFGYSVAISGNYAVVGAPFEASATGVNTGKAYIFNVTTGALVHTLSDVASPSADDYFGQFVAISGNTVAVSSISKIFIFNVSTGNTIASYYSPDVECGPVATFGNCVVNSTVDSLGNQSINVRFVNLNTGDATMYTIDNPNPSPADDEIFGSWLGIDGNNIIAGHEYQDALVGSLPGKAYIFSAVNGTLIHTLESPDQENIPSNARFGTSVAISGNYAAVGSMYHNNDTSGDTGSVFLFEVDTGNLVATIPNPNPFNLTYLFGRTVSMSDGHLVVGSLSGTVEDTYTSGRTQVYAAKSMTYLDKIVTLSKNP